VVIVFKGFEGARLRTEADFEVEEVEYESFRFE
jgi:hypothetical protein